MEVLYTDYSVEKDLIYKITESGSDYKVMVYKLSTEEIINANEYEGPIEDCISYITNKTTE